MYKYRTLALKSFAVLFGLAGIHARADNMASIAITSGTGVVTLAPHWAIGGNLAGFHLMSQDWGLTGGAANQFYSIKNTAIPSGGDILAYNFYVAGSGAATPHADIGSKLTPDTYSALTSADPDVGYGSINQYLIHHKGTTDYFSVIKPGAATASSVTDLKPMSGPGGPSTVTGVSGYFGLTFAAANLGYGLNRFYYLRTDALTGFTKFGTLDPALAGVSADQFDLGMGGYNALAFTGTDLGYGTDKMYYLRLDPITGYTILGTLHPLTGKVADIANLGSIYSTLTFVPGDVGFGSGRFYTTGSVNTTWQSISFAAIDDRTLSAGSFTVAPSASSGLTITLTVVSGSATISGPVAGVFTVTPTGPGLITLQAAQAGQLAPTPYEFNMLRQSFTVSANSAVTSDFNSDGQSDVLWRNRNTGEVGVVLMNGTTVNTYAMFHIVGPEWQIGGIGDFNADGKPDILWRNILTGEVGVVLMNGTTVNTYVMVNLVGLEWQIGGVGDFNADGKPDILWRNRNTGEVGVVLMNGTTVTTYTMINLVGPEWQIAGTGDFNGDGKTDVLWRNGNTGEVGVVMMNGTTVTTYTMINLVGPEWQIGGTSDFNVDGKIDILWRNIITGEAGVVLMNGTSIITYANINFVGLEWQMTNR